jgi:hypothetical protein
MGALGRAVGCLALVVASVAEAAPSVRIDGPADACPAPRALRAAVARLLPGVVLTDDAGDEQAVVVRIEDEGAAYVVAIATQRHELRDPARDCVERARAAAVLVVMALQPPAVAEAASRPAAAPATRPASVPTPPVVPRPAPAPRRRALVTLDVGAAAAAALPGKRNDAGATGGAAVRLNVGRRFGAALGVGGLAPVTLDLPQGRARVTRVPVDLDAFAALPIGRFDLLFALGLAAAVVSVEGQGFPVPVSATRADLGLHAGVAVRWWRWGRVAPYAAVEAELLPVPYDLAVAGRGTVGSTPRWWLRLVLGLTVSLDGRL